MKHPKTEEGHTPNSTPFRFFAKVLERVGEGGGAKPRGSGLSATAQPPISPSNDVGTVLSLLSPLGCGALHEMT